MRCSVLLMRERVADHAMCSSDARDKLDRERRGRHRRREEGESEGEASPSEQEAIEAPPSKVEPGSDSDRDIVFDCEQPAPSHQDQ